MDFTACCGPTMQLAMCQMTNDSVATNNANSTNNKMQTVV